VCMYRSHTHSTLVLYNILLLGEGGDGPDGGNLESKTYPVLTTKKSEDRVVY